MSLFDDASLVLTPNGYKASKLYSIKPTSGLGDMTVVRATSATRVNSAGLIEIARTNLVLQSQTFENVYWVKNLGGVASAPVVTPNVETAPDGTTTADRVVFNLNGGTASGDISQLESALFSSVSITRTQSVYIKTTDGTTKVFTFVSPTGAATSITVTSVYQRFTWTTTAINAGTIRLRLRGSASGEGTATSATIAIWGAQYEDGSVATDYIPTTTSIRTKFAGITQDGSSASNIPRIDYPPLGGCPSILVEPQRTNLLTYSEQFDNAGWNKTNTTVTANTTTSPDGTLTADKIIPNTTNGTHNVNRSITVSTSTAYTASLYAKKGEYSGLRINFISSANTFISVNLNTGVIQSFGGSIYLSSSIESVGNDWYRVTMTFLPPVATSSLNFIVENPVGTVTFAGDNTSGIYLWGAQLESGSNATSYIPTVAATVTRNADSFTLNNIYTNGLLSASGGTWFVDLRNNIPLTRDANSVGLNLDTSLGSNGFAIRNNASAQRLTISKYISNVRTELYLTTTNTCKIAIKWNGTTADIFENGTKVVSATSFTPTAMQVINGSSTDVSKNINQMSLWATPLTDTQLAILTTI